MALDNLETIPGGPTHIDMGEEDWVGDLAESIDASGSDSLGDNDEDGLNALVGETLRSGSKAKPKESKRESGDTGDETESTDRDDSGRFVSRKSTEEKPAARVRAPYFPPELLEAAQAEGIDPNRYDNEDRLERDIWRARHRRSRQAESQPAKKDEIPEPQFELPTEDEIGDPKMAKLLKGLVEQNTMLTKQLKGVLNERGTVKSELEEIKSRQRDSESRQLQAQRETTTRMLDELYEGSDDSVKEFLARPSEALGGADSESADRAHALGEYMKDRWDGMVARGEEPDLKKLWAEGIRALWPELNTKQTTREIQRKLDRQRGATATRSSARQTQNGRLPSVVTDRRAAVKNWRSDLRRQGILDD